MLLHDFIYEWDGKSSKGEKPISWWPGSYRVKIVRLATDSNNISYLVHTAVILKNAKTNPAMNTSLKNYIHNFARIISKEYNLNIDKTLWIELDDKIRVASLNPEQKLSPEILYTISWRSIRPNELAMIKPYITDM
ncbi:MAG: hypothetical protein HOG03_02115 [Desulfobacula sp.]|jgi:hypothetical protein|uniref:hypothetical protein n=1 Tax=Desulfobacula sp. TaxID=2593537 RepID=UPI001D64A628|nr:hypothetical protein [Desulfobacula sp.]MBT3485750.1 hypothetical protein [Desulfobacula sp.]MBT3803374.1 hypothetical protein [Desulfobacula sp.]MBT4024295.1 hypothetical protein [Desulfobacula sp.]MBT4198302.1 hypothetical protein [Desulfobacula sp.]